MDLETTIPVYVLIGSVVSFLIAIFNKENTKYEENKNKYFEEVLLPYFGSYKNNTNIEFKLSYDINNQSHGMEFIPEYVQHLIREDRREELNKVLLVDYFDSYPSKKNSIKKSMNRIFNIADIIMYFAYFIMLLLITLLITRVIPLIISEICYTITNTGSTLLNFDEVEVPMYLFFIVILLLLVLVYVFAFIFFDKSISKKDMYSYDKKIIEKMIKLRIKRYRKIEKNNIIINLKESKGYIEVDNKKE